MLTSALALGSLLAATPITVQRSTAIEALKVISVQGAPTGSRFAAGLENGDVRIVDANTGHSVLTLKGHPQAVYGLAWSPDGQRLVTGDETSRIFVWNARTGQRQSEFPRGAMSHGRGIQSLSFTADGRTLISTGKDDVIIMWDFATMKPRTRIAGNGVVFSSATLARNAIVTATLTEGIHFRNAPSFALTQRVDPTGGVGVNELAVNPAATRAVSAGRDNTVGVWDLSGRRLLGRLRGHEDWVQRVAISPNGRIAASSANDRTVRVWNLVTMQPVTTLSEQSAVGAPLTFTGDGRFLISSTISDGLQINRVSPPQSAAPAPRRATRRR